MLFVATNLAILVVLGVVVILVGLDSASTTGLLIIAVIFGMGGSFLSLAMSKWIAKRATGAEVIDHPRGHVEAWLLQTVERQARKSTKKDALKVGIASGIGAVVGGIAGGGKGAGIGAGAGAGAGTGAVLVTRGDAAALPAESILQFELQSPLTVTK